MSLAQIIQKIDANKPLQNGGLIRNEHNNRYQDAVLLAIDVNSACKICFTSDIYLNRNVGLIGRVTRLLKLHARRCLNGIKTVQVSNLHSL
jgi:hypothetical protein